MSRKLFLSRKNPNRVGFKNMPDSDKKTLMVIAFRDFRDEEYFTPKKILEDAGLEVKTASNKKGVAIGADGGETEVDFLISEINPDDFNAIIFIGGPGCLNALDSEDSYHLIREAVSKEKILAAICISPVILAKAGTLKGKNATVWNSALERSPVRTLEDNGAIYEDESVVIDGKIITANGPAAAKEFAEEIVRLLTKEQ